MTWLWPVVNRPAAKRQGPFDHARLDRLMEFVRTPSEHEAFKAGIAACVDLLDQRGDQPDAVVILKHFGARI